MHNAPAAISWPVLAVAVCTVELDHVLRGRDMSTQQSPSFLWMQLRGGKWDYYIWELFCPFEACASSSILPNRNVMPALMLRLLYSLLRFET